MKSSKNGFTLSEILIAIGLVGVISAIVFSTLIHNKPNKNKAMFRKAYYIVERAAADMMMDDDNFPSVDVDGSRGIAYFDTSVDPDDEDTYEITKYPPYVRNMKNTGKNFCEAFASKLNKDSVQDKKCEKERFTFKKNPTGYTMTYYSTPSFTTSDGIAWYMTSNIICDPDDKVANPEGDPCVVPDEDMPDCPRKSEKAPYTCVYFDVNGPNELPNKFVHYKGQSESEEVRDADKGWFYVFWNGQIKAPPGQAQKYLKSVTVF